MNTTKIREDTLFIETTSSKQVNINLFYLKQSLSTEIVKVSQTQQLMTFKPSDSQMRTTEMREDTSVMETTYSTKVNRFIISDNEFTYYNCYHETNRTTNDIYTV
ncbi:hypothetical protein RF11_13502 [Thelohanellus kitauei]|uniref:Uncharacterized protein n=1 Tax=Thelohanellus kitauei TaxID=669202 RepID=A0A0C2MGA7_THEKT|nr:hypothetical protein RF11_13502 [Thelohanellus kitauei]